MVTALVVLAVLVAALVAALARAVRRAHRAAGRAETNAAKARTEVARLERAFAETLHRMADTYPSEATRYMPRLTVPQDGRR